MNFCFREKIKSNLLRGLPESKADLKADFISGLSVTALVLPQTMAYSLIAGLPPVYGLYSAIIGMITASILTSSKYLIVGPANITSLAIASVLSGIPEENYLQAVLLFTFMVGIIQMLTGLLKLGELVKYISRSVINGLLTGVGLLIISGQLGYFFGFKHPPGSNIFMEFYYFIININEINIHAIIISSLSLILIFFIKRYKADLAYLIPMTISIVLVYFLGWESNLEVAGAFPPGLPTFNLFEFENSFMLNYWSAALSTALLGLMYTLSTIKALKLKTGQDIDFNQAFLNQGFVNIACSFYGGFMTSGSMTKSFANLQAGARSKFSQLISAISILPVLIFFQSLGTYIPIPALGSIVIVVAAGMIDFNEIKNSFQNKFDGIIFTITFITTIFAPRIDYAIYFGIGISLILVLKNSSGLNYSYLTYQSQRDDFISNNSCSALNKEYILINLSGNITFNSINCLKKEFNNHESLKQKFIIRMQDVENIDLSFIKELEYFINKVQRNNGKVIFAGLNKNIANTLKDYGLDSLIGKENIYLSKDKLFASTKMAIKQATRISLSKSNS